MSLIKDYPCPHCGANLHKVGFHEILYEGTLYRSHYYIDGYHNHIQDAKYHNGYIECGNCCAQLNENPKRFMKMVEKEWD